MNLGIMFKYYRIFARKNLRELSKEIGISAATLSRIENDNYKPDLVTFKKILNWLI